MTRALVLPALALALALGACTFQTPDFNNFGKEKSLIVPPPPEDGIETPVARNSCGAASFESLVGHKWDPAKVTLPRGARVIRPGDLVTQDYVPARLNIHLDAKDKVVRVTCG